MVYNFDPFCFTELPTMPPPSRLTWRSFLTVEPVIFLYAYGLFMAMPTLQQFVYYKISLNKGFPYNPAEKKGFGCPSGNSSNTTMKNIEDEVMDCAIIIRGGF